MVWVDIFFFNWSFSVETSPSNTKYTVKSGPEKCLASFEKRKKTPEKSLCIFFWSALQLTGVQTSLSL